MKTEKKSQNAYMKEALVEAEKAKSEGEVPVGCVIVKDGTIVARARNSVEKEGCVLGHAELNAIETASEKLGKFLYGCEMYVTVEPCAMCAGAISHARIDGLYFGAREERTGCCGSLYNIPEDDRFFTTVKVTGGVMEEECKRLIREFFAERRKG